jgi:hypothetical protein
MNEEAIRLSCGIGEAQWGGHPVARGKYACISPVYGRGPKCRRVNQVWVPGGVQVLQDCGACSDDKTNRLDFGAALARQIAHAERYHSADQITHRASSDVLIDEKCNGGKRSNHRWTEAEAEEAVAITTGGARHLNQHRTSRVGAVLSAQGISPKQYLACTQAIVPLLEPGDLFGFGGFAVLGKKPKQMLPVFLETIDLVIPFLGREQVKCVHIWGVCFVQALGELLRRCDEYSIAVSTDSMGPSLRKARGRWGKASWSDPSRPGNRQPKF